MALTKVTLEIPTRLKNSNSDQSVADERFAGVQKLKEEFSDRVDVSWGHETYENPDTAVLSISPKYNRELTPEILEEIHTRALEIFQ